MNEYDSVFFKSEKPKIVEVSLKIREQRWMAILESRFSKELIQEYHQTKRSSFSPL